jgi:prephenate dehydratase
VPRVGFLGPLGTFTEQALLTQADLAAMDLVPLVSNTDVLDAVQGGEVELGFVPIENAIEGTVREIVDSLALEHDLLIQREVVIDIHLDLLAPTGTSIDDIQEVVSMPMASAQARGWLAKHLPGVTVRASNSTAEAAEHVGRDRPPGVAAIAPAIAAELYGLQAIATEIEDHPENKTRFVVVAREGVQPMTGHDKTSIVCFQSADRPGSLLGILQEFAARAINLTKLESRPTKQSLGDYCFLIDFEGHLSDDVVADCLRELKAKNADVKFLGSYPAAGEHGEAVRREAVASWRAADEWLQDLRSRIPPG